MPVEPPPPPIDPAQAREDRIADNTRAEEAANDFLGLKQSALFTGPDPFFAKQGSDAIKAATGTLSTLSQARNDLMDGLGNDAQRKRAGTMLDAQMRLTRDDVVRHASDQYLAWQRQTAQNRIDSLTQEAALHHNDDGRIDAMANAAALAARAKARVGDQPPGGDAENDAADLTRSSVLNSAIQSRLDAGNTSGASALYDRAKDQLDPTHASPLGAQIDTAQRFEAAKEYAGGVMPETPGATPDEIEAQRATATQQNQTDNSDDPEHLRLAQHFIDVGFDGQQNDLQQAKAARDDAVEKWIATPTPDGKPQTNFPPPAIWNQLNTGEQGSVLARLRVNASSNSPQVKSDSASEPVQPGQQYAEVPPDAKPEDEGDKLRHEIRKGLHEETPEERYEHGEAPLEIMPPIAVPLLKAPSGSGKPPAPSTPPAPAAKPSAPQPNSTVSPLSPPVAGTPSNTAPSRQETLKTWGRSETLDKHFDDHGADFGTTSAEEYADRAHQFYLRAQRRGVLMKVDPEDGTIRYYEPSTNTFGAYNADGTTKTFYKPDPREHKRPTNMDYWNDQPGFDPRSP